MTKEKLKQEIHKLVDQENRIGHLRDLKNFLEKSGEKDFWDELTPQQQKAIDEAIAQVDRGETYLYDDIRKEIKDKYGF